MTSEDLGYKPGEVGKVKFEYCPLGGSSEKRIKKYDKGNKVIKYHNNFIFYSVHKFNKYNVSNEIASVDPKFDILNKF